MKRDHTKFHQFTLHLVKVNTSVITKAPREGASFITSQSELGGYQGGGGCGGGGVGPNWWVFSAIPGQNPVAKGACFGTDFGPLE